MDTAYFIKGLEFAPEIFLGVLLIYGFLLLCVNIFGLKSFSKMSSYDFVHTIATGSLIASAVMNGTPSLFTGMITIIAMFGVKWLISIAKLKSETISKLVNNEPIYVMRHGKVLHDNLRKSRMTEDELRGKLREANVIRMKDVKAVVLETTGDVSVLHGEKDYDVDDYLLDDVRQ